MAFKDVYTEKVRAALSHIPRVEEKKCYGGLTFMVNEAAVKAQRDFAYWIRLALDYNAKVHSRGMTRARRSGDDVERHCAFDGRIGSHRWR